MKELFLHIGYPKAGSSAIQTTLNASRAALKDGGFVYPEAPSGLHNAFAAHFHPAPETLYPYCEAAGGDAERRQLAVADFERLARRIARTKRPRLILSSESLFDLDSVAIGRVRDWLSPRFERITIICYARHPVTYTSSLIQERVKQGQSLGELADFFQIGNFRFYTRLLRAWAQTFGRERMIVRPFEREQLAGGDVVTDFARQIGYDGPLDRTERYDNPSLSQAATLLLSAVNELPGAPRARLPAWVRAIPGPPFSLPRDELEGFARRCGEHIDYLAEEWGVRFGPSATVPDERQAFGPETLAFIARHIAA